MHSIVIVFPLIVLIIVVIVLIVLSVGVYHRPRFKMTSYTQGKVEQSSVREVRTEFERYEQTEIVVAYHVAGQVHRLTKTVPGNHAGRYPIGLSLRVHYNPSDPEMARADDAGR